MAPGHMARRVLITGANGGIGFEVAKQILAKGHNIILTCRDASKAEKAVALLEPTAKVSGGSVEYAILDLANLDNVRLGATSLLNRHPKLDVLVANAGVMSNAPPGAPLQRTVDGQELTLQANHLGHFLLIHLLLPALLAAPAGRVVVVSSELHRKVKGVEGSSGSSTSGSSNAQGLTDIHPGGSGATASPQWLPRLSTAGTSSGAPTAPAVATAPAATSAPPPPWATAPPQPCPLSGMQLYCLSKLYNLWFVSGLAARLPPHVTANAVTPGWVPGTSLGRDAPWLARLVYQNVFPLLPITVSVPEGARRVVAVCLGEAEGAVRGGYFSRGKQAEPSAEARDKAAAEELWRLSEAAAGIAPGAYVPAEGKAGPAGAQ
ncbi:hypothetical protein CHLRE_09g397400v5 [Chlamydomonas reinhardtii]|uniref:Protochlorophyllide reductase n=1 Tax=Chlamydomonas reinhardtii TaxID=3055 RepID=A8J019_CHLRE|nr:uncharacterized protein CHLRE_09g397400v5 [Chlamydomonas reinhardtii]PNW78437.1 hypothetical protein CHLRE_09g397400v5 [Chlamydomonas reinhardtii]|eukprot:XP_001694621.1 predicted protein [Chlamydomonas reinhardtii]